MKFSPDLVAKQFARVGLFAAGLLLAQATHAQTTLSFDFESFDNGPILDQQGWSAGNAASYLTVDGLTTDESIVSTAAHDGSKSWELTHGINNLYSFGPGTPFSPNLGLATSFIGSSFQGSFWFKPVSVGDGSWMEIDTGNPAGDDRAEFVAYLNNYDGNLSVTTVDLNSIEVPVVAGLDPGVWHLIDFSVMRTGLESNTLNLQIDGGPVYSTDGILAAYRQGSSPYEVSSRVKFVGSPSSSGFYVDDVSYTVIPEPSTYAMIAGLGALALARFRRPRAKALS